MAARMQKKPDLIIVPSPELESDYLRRPRSMPRGQDFSFAERHPTVDESAGRVNCLSSEIRLDNVRIHMSFS